jgi:hypothetical protein
MAFGYARYRRTREAYENYRCRSVLKSVHEALGVIR